MEYCVTVTKKYTDVGRRHMKMGYNRIYKVNISIMKLCVMGKTWKGINQNVPFSYLYVVEFEEPGFFLRALTLAMFNVNILVIFVIKTNSLIH